LCTFIECHVSTLEKNRLFVISGEWGYSTFTNKGISLQMQAAFLVRQQLANLYAGVPISIWYDWKNDGADLAEREQNFGVVTHDLQPKPAYLALQTLTRELSGYRIEKRLATSNTNDWVLLLSKGPERKLAAWTTGETHLATVGGLNCTSVNSVSGVGKVAEAKLEQDSLSLTLTAMPQYVTLKP